MLLWFATLGLGGLVQILQAPEVLAALDPMRALGAVAHGGLRSALLLGGVVLAVTGVEALYADMGHFGRPAISRAWHCIVLPSLILNYLGLAAIAIRHPGASREGIFFQMVPQGIPTLLLVLLATLATIIASQALISGVFSLTAQARDLGLLPRFLVCHTSSAQAFWPSSEAKTLLPAGSDCLVPISPKTTPRAETTILQRGAAEVFIVP
jgi:KUP system potassium uptake protein